MTIPDDLIRGNAEAARLTGRDPRTIRSWVAQGKLTKHPDPDNPRGVSYRRDDLLALASRMVEAGPGRRADNPSASPAVPVDLSPLAALIERQAAEIARLSAELAALRAEPPARHPPALPAPKRGWRAWVRKLGG